MKINQKPKDKKEVSHNIRAMEDLYKQQAVNLGLKSKNITFLLVSTMRSEWSYQLNKIHIVH